MANRISIATENRASGGSSVSSVKAANMAEALSLYMRGARLEAGYEPEGMTSIAWSQQQEIRVGRLLQARYEQTAGALASIQLYKASLAHD